MTASHTIDPLDSGNPLNYQNLMSEGLSLMQQLAGEVWTDYNLHDPGVTLLEQLCFSLTDVVYRSSYPIQQYLIGPDNKIDLPTQGLYSPGKILPSGPVTLHDYKALMLAKLTSINALVIDMSKLYQQPSLEIRYNCRSYHGKKAKQQLINDMVSHYHAQRPLCAPISVAVAEMNAQMVELYGCVDIKEGYPVEQVIAQIYLECADLITPESEFIRYESLLEQGCGLEEVIEGPFCAQGRLKETPIKRNLQISHLTERITALAGTKQVSQLHLVAGDKQFYQYLVIDQHSQCKLAIPYDDLKLFKLEITQGGRAYPIQLSEYQMAIRQGIARKEKTALLMRHHEQIFPHCEDNYLAFNRHIPIQSLFPANYQISPQGIPYFASSQQQAQAKQLNGYLMLFEQFIANSIEDIEQFRTLLSLDMDTTRSYHYQSLMQKDAQALYVKQGQQRESALASAIAEIDNYSDRKHRALDYLLGLYGESYPDEKHRQFNCYFTKVGFEHELIHAKVNFIKYLPQLGLLSGIGQNYLLEPWSPEDCSGVSLKSRLLLNCAKLTNCSITTLFNQLRLNVVESEKWDLPVIAASDQGPSQLETDRKLKLDFRPAISVVAQSCQETALSTLYQQLKEAGLFKADQINAEFLVEGVDSQRYRCGWEKIHNNEQRGKKCLLVFNRGSHHDWYQLGVYDSIDKAKTVARLCQQFLVGLNRYSEGVHLLEHIVLHPSSVGKAKAMVTEPNHDSFYYGRLSLLMPNWPARYANPDFQAFAQAVIRDVCPAHLHPDIFWLSFVQMQQYESLYSQWRKEVSHVKPNQKQIHLLRLQLVDFIQSLSKADSSRADSDG
ncbi:hypothetical protein [Spartinivicinus poritis]|uniref:Uncharacterized protein n=1 Tax=Spartinivicinus poritis TaxID=2994640 RepID=A0ABT5U2T4_9GAMM|nr:hypothetical protein [Spartinivicinus sp. A2-2]MDE1460675.1 hypothetical protein [Spartinivicinus sp. A2-2]